MHTELVGSHGRTYDHLFKHPSPHSVDWRELSSMLHALSDATVVQEHNGNLKITRNEIVLVLHRPHGKDIVDKDEIARVRHFIERSGNPVAATPGSGTHLLVVIDHHEARIFSAELRGTSPHRITPYDPFGYGRELRHTQTGGDGELQPERKSFYEAVAKTLRGAQQILLFGTATGASNAMEHLLLELKKHHPEIAERVVGSFIVDEHHLTEDQLLAKARDLFSKKMAQGADEIA
jgi:hypothetical protein